MTDKAQPGESQEDMPLMRGKSGAIAAAAAIMGIAGVALSLATWTGAARELGAGHPPSFIAVSMGMCAMLLGVGAVYRERGMAGRRAVRTLAVAGLLLGMAESVIYSKQALDYRVGMERQEMANVQHIVDATRAYAKEHGGAFPPDLETLVKHGALQAADLVTPFGLVPDYVYVGKDLTLAQVAASGDEGATLMLVHGKDLRLGILGSVGFADGQAKFLPAEELDKAVQADAAARHKLGLPPATMEAASRAGEGR